MARRLAGTLLAHLLLFVAGDTNLTQMLACSVNDGSGVSTTYPCLCGFATCISVAAESQICTAANNSCVNVAVPTEAPTFQPCSVIDGSNVSAAYPCKCGLATCASTTTGTQICTASDNSCIDQLNPTPAPAPAPCSVADGSGLSAAYPCTCGSSICETTTTGSQACTASGNSCMEAYIVTPAPTYPACTVMDGSNSSAFYPCTCGLSTCVSTPTGSQICTASAVGNSCTEHIVPTTPASAPPCSVSDGSGFSTAYPCQCGTWICTETTAADGVAQYQICTADVSSCAGMLQPAAPPAPQEPSNITTNSTNTSNGTTPVPTPPSNNFAHYALITLGICLLLPLLVLACSYFMCYDSVARFFEKKAPQTRNARAIRDPSMSSLSASPDVQKYVAPAPAANSMMPTVPTQPVAMPSYQQFGSQPAVGTYATPQPVQSMPLPMYNTAPGTTAALPKAVSAATYNAPSYYAVQAPTEFAVPTYNAPAPTEFAMPTYNAPSYNLAPGYAPAPGAAVPTTAALPTQVFDGYGTPRSGMALMGMPTQYLGQ